MKDPENLLKLMDERKKFATFKSAHCQIEATLILAEQVKRIADLLEEWSIESPDGSRTLFVSTDSG